MWKEKLLAIVKKILNMGEDFSSLQQLDEHEPAELVVAIRKVHERLKKPWRAFILSRSHTIQSEIRV